MGIDISVARYGIFAHFIPSEFVFLPFQQISYEGGEGKHRPGGEGKGDG